MARTGPPGSRVVGAHMLPSDSPGDAPWNELEIGAGTELDPVIPEYALDVHPPGDALHGTILALVQKLNDLETRVAALEP